MFVLAALRKTAPQIRDDTRQAFLDAMQSQLAVAFVLRFAEELIGSLLVRKFGMAGDVLLDISGFVTGPSRLDV